MAFVNETSIWEPQIYELETTDPVIGGPAGISNLTRQQLANRTKKIYDVLEENGIFVTESSHGFVGQNIDVTAVFEGSVVDSQVVYYNESNARYEKALAGTGDDREFFVGVADVTNGRVIAGGLVTVTADLTLSKGDIVYLSSTLLGHGGAESSNVPIGKVLWRVSPTTAVIALNSGVGTGGGGSFDHEQDTYRMLLDGSYFERGTWDNFFTTDLIDAGNTDGDHDFGNNLFELTSGEDLVSINLRDPLASGNVTGALLSVDYTGPAPTVWLAADGTSWEVVVLDQHHQFVTTGTDLRIWLRATGTTTVRSWAVLYEPNEQESSLIGQISHSQLNQDQPEYHFTKASINHSDINDDEPTQHRVANDSVQSGTTLWSSNKVANELVFNTPVGTIIAWGGQAMPTGWFECNGVSLHRVTYVTLFNAIGTNYGTLDINHFSVPDFRGMFLRAWDHGRNFDQQAAARTPSAIGGIAGDNPGSYQADDFLSHNHTMDSRLASLGTPASLVPQAGFPGGGFTTDSTGNPFETRPRNVTVVWIIKAYGY